MRGTVRIEQPRVPVGKPERQAEAIQPILLDRERGFLTDAFPDQIAARHEHPGGDFRAGEVTGAAAEQGFTVHTEKGCAFGAEDLTQAGRELVAIFFKSFPFMDRADFAAADIEGRFFLLRRRPRGTFPAQPDTAEEHEGGFLGGLGFGFAPEGIQELGAPPFGEPILDGHVGIFEDFKAFVEQVKRVLRRFFAEEDRLQPQCVPPHHGARADLGLAEQGIEIDAGQGREAVFGIEHREFEDPEVVVGQGEGRVALGLPQGIGEQVIGHFGPAHAGIAERDGGESPEHQLGVGGHRRTGDDGLEGFQGVILAAHVGVEDAEVLAEDLGGHDVPFQFRRADGGFDHAEGVGEVAGVGGGGCRLEHELRFEERQYGLMGALLEHFVAFERLLEVPPDEVHQDEEGRDPGIQLLVVQRLEQLHGGVERFMGPFEMDGAREECGGSLREPDEHEGTFIPCGGGVFGGLFHEGGGAGRVLHIIEGGVVGGKGIMDEGTGFRGGEPAVLPLRELIEEQLEISGTSGRVGSAPQDAHTLRADLAGRFRHFGFAGGDEFFERRARVAEQEGRQSLPQMVGPGLRQVPCFVPLFREAVGGHSVQGYFRLRGGTFEHLDEAQRRAFLFQRRQKPENQERC